ncbi:pyrroline-5-carboxylate reductase [Bacillus sp. ISL-47]|uniref:pyrroline-5-carboxylate reductase n=1 Tax=Bacillus sp. ISL-47 TaxID=2819130 RepID=UPI001BEA0E08|nr:pyrroline-5-carboxylate reductase [Bacillus sp. ISL-47]MBT2690692.1 pyrroline-5-carboxylate reductase [Bacillus sp. ISL-47]MBT2709637.1 pyrroline-5-carboxylate reductase [Pseudomonas sp. ISL-84]
MNKKIGFIGCGKMAQAIIGGIIKSKLLIPGQIIATANTKETLADVKNRLGIEISLTNKHAAVEADILFLAVKPDLHIEVIKEIKDSIKPGAIIITIAAGISLDYLERAFGQKIKAIRSMPNTPSLVGEGMSAIAANKLVSAEDLEVVIQIFSSIGRAEVMDEKMMDAIPAISGSSPAYVYMFIEALADGGVRAGVPREQSYQLAAQAVLGAAKMVLETGKHPAELKDQVCTPGGATIEAIAKLEKKGFRAAVLSAMEECYDKTKALSDNKK